MDFILLIAFFVLSYLSVRNIPDLAPYIIVIMAILFFYISIKNQEKNT